MSRRSAPEEVGALDEREEFGLSVALVMQHYYINNLGGLSCPGRCLSCDCTPYQRMQAALHTLVEGGVAVERFTVDRPHPFSPLSVGAAVRAEISVN